MSTSEGDRWLTVKDKEKNIYVTKVKLLMTIKVPVQAQLMCIENTVMKCHIEPLLVNKLSLCKYL